MNIKRPTEDQIRLRAYEIYFARGSYKPGQELADWAQAERELMELAADAAAAPKNDKPDKK